MRFSVLGCGYLGAVHAVCMTSLGYDVVGIDISEWQVSALSRGRAPFFEPGLPDLLRAGVESGRLRFTTETAEAKGATVHFICVGTPQQQGENAADMQFVNAAVEELIPFLEPGDLVVGKSTVPVGTAERLAAQIAEAVPGATLLWNPEFLREGHAVKDTLEPDRFVYGVEAGPQGEEAVRRLDEVYANALAQGTRAWSPTWPRPSS